jgi:hypothetical protein
MLMQSHEHATPPPHLLNSFSQVGWASPTKACSGGRCPPYLLVASAIWDETLEKEWFPDKTKHWQQAASATSPIRGVDIGSIQLFLPV